MEWQNVSVIDFIREFPDYIHCAHVKGVWVAREHCRAGRLGGHRPMGHWTNGWNFVTAGTARDANSLEEIFIELNRVGFDGAVSIEWEDNDAGPVRGSEDGAGELPQGRPAPERPQARRSPEGMICGVGHRPDSSAGHGLSGWYASGLKPNPRSGGAVMRTLVQAGIVAFAGAAGVAAALFFFSPPRNAGAASNDRYQDSIMATGAVTANPKIQTDGVWLPGLQGGQANSRHGHRPEPGEDRGWAESISRSAGSSERPTCTS
ncbi:MAG: hypothetical protein U0792_10235 [Gemmataceae bacterium]